MNKRIMIVALALAAAPLLAMPTTVAAMPTAFDTVFQNKPCSGIGLVLGDPGSYHLKALGDGGSSIILVQAPVDTSITSLIAQMDFIHKGEGVGEIVRPEYDGDGRITAAKFPDNDERRFQDRIKDQLDAGNYPLPPARKFSERNLKNTRTA